MEKRRGEGVEDATREYLMKVGDLKGMLNDRARNGFLPSEQEYAKLRAELIAIPPIRDALPNFVLRHRTIEEFWQFIKPKYTTCGERTEFLPEDFKPILSWLEGGTKAGKQEGKTFPAREGVDMIKVLLLSANPIDSPLSIDEEFRAIDKKIRSSEHRDHVELFKHGAVRLEDVAGLLMRHKPHVVHFSGHGDANGIALTGADGKGRLVPPDALANIFRALKDNVRVVLLNACDSAPQAEAIVSEIDCAVGMSDEIDDDAAIAFAAAFYEALGYGRSVQTAFDLPSFSSTARARTGRSPSFTSRRGVKPAEIVLVTRHALGSLRRSAGGRPEGGGVASGPASPSNVSGRVVYSERKEWLYSNLLKVTLPEQIYVANTAHRFPGPSGPRCDRLAARSARNGCSPRNGSSRSATCGNTRGTPSATQ